MKKNSKTFLLTLLLVGGLAAAPHVKAAEAASFVVRNGSSVLFEGVLEILDDSTPLAVEATDSATGEAVEKTVSPNSVFGFLKRAEESAGAFTLSDVEYFSSFDSLIVNCVKAGDEEFCDNWQYVVDNVYPSVGMDKFDLAGDEQVYFYFGNSRQVVPPDQSLRVLRGGERFTVSAHAYQYQNNTWAPLSGVTIGLLKENPEDAFSPTELETQSVDSQGIASFEGAEPGTYLLGIKEDFYFPTVALSVAPHSGGGGGSPSPASSLAQGPDKETMVEFLVGQQEEDGSFGNALFTDWAAVAFGAFNPQHPAAENLKAYLESNPDPGVSLGSSVLSFERRAMALMALGINPYSGTPTNYIEKIVEAYNGQQVGDKNLVNDDIFALLILRKAGYGQETEIIQNISRFIQSQQEPGGSFGGVDMTAAAVQSLALVVPVSKEAGESIQRAKLYLRTRQTDEGGFGNPDSTSWAMQAIAVFGEDWRAWDKSGNTPGEYLALFQQENGSIESAAPVWSSAYAIPAGLGKPWGDILSNFEKPFKEKESVQEQPLPDETLISYEPGFFRAPGEEPSVPVQIVIQEETPDEAMSGEVSEASGETVLQKIAAELAAIEEKVEVLEMRVGLVYAEYRLAQARQDLLAAQQGSPLAKAPQEDENQADSGTQEEKGSDEDAFAFSEEQFAAQAAQAQEGNDVSFAFAGQGVIALLTGAALFFVLGGPRLVNRLKKERQPATQSELL